MISLKYKLVYLELKEYSTGLQIKSFFRIYINY